MGYPALFSRTDIANGCQFGVWISLNHLSVALANVSLAYNSKAYFFFVRHGLC
jgi:hypothetical protein